VAEPEDRRGDRERHEQAQYRHHPVRQDAALLVRPIDRHRDMPGALHRKRERPGLLLSRPGDLPRLHDRTDECGPAGVDLHVAGLDAVRELVAVVTAADGGGEPGVAEVVDGQLGPSAEAALHGVRD
jgi:hypothetical protein